MRVAVLIIVLLVPGLARAGELPACHFTFDDIFAEKTVDTLVRHFRCDLERRGEVRERFDAAAKNSMLDPDCRCLKFLLSGQVKRMPYPLSGDDRIRLFDGLTRGTITPLGPKQRS